MEVEKQSREGLMDASAAVERMLQNNLSTVLSLLVEGRQRAVTKEVRRGPHRDKEQWERLREITTVQIALTVLGRLVREGIENRGEQGPTRDRVRRKMQSWVVTKSLNIIAPEVMSQGVSRRNNAQEWTKQRWTFLEEKHGLSLLTVKRKLNVPQVEVREEVPIGR